MTRFLLVRHAEAEGNPENRFIGQSDVELTKLGRTQAKAVSRRLQSFDPDALYSSDLPRVTATIAPLSRSSGLPIETDERLREIGSGEWTGLTPAEIGLGWPDLWETYTAGRDVLRPGGESWAHVRGRTVGFVEEVAAAHPDDAVVVATHAGPITAILLWAARADYEGAIFAGPFHVVANASITVIDAEPGGSTRIVTVNDTGHLPLDGGE